MYNHKIKLNFTPLNKIYQNFAKLFNGVASKPKSYFTGVLVSIVCFGIFGVAERSEAKNLYVATTGDDAVSYLANDIDHPWATPQKAWYNAQAGDTAYFREGTYVITSMIDTRLSGGYDGTEQNPVRFQNYNGESVTLDGQTSPVVDIERDWEIISGFNLISPATFFRFGENTPDDGLIIENCIHNQTVGGDNTGIVKINSASNVTVRNCRIIGPGLGAHGNTAGIIVFGSSGIKIENNEISNFPEGIYYKHSNALVDSGVTFKNNFIYDCIDGIHSVANYATIENNLLVNSIFSMGNDGGVGEGWVGADYNTIEHNTVYGGAMEFDYQTRDADPNKGCLYNTVRNNLLSSLWNLHPYASLPHYTTSDYNLYPTGNIIAENRINYNLTAWQSYYSQDSHSVSGAPVFSGGATPSSIADFALALGSLGKNAGSDGNDMGVDVSLVGIQEQIVSDIIPPAAPSGLSVQ